MFTGKKTRTRTVSTAVALLASAALLTGCSGSEDGGKAGKGSEAGAANDQSSGGAQAKPKGDAGKKTATREVTFEVAGKGTSTVTVMGGGLKGEPNAALPWKKTEKITLEGAELTVGVYISVFGGPVQADNGMLEFPACSITVDGKKVAQKPQGEKNALCEYTLK
ncbi:hypothetical protein H9Y04_34365 [Streptomyces sp. TRM66268-LWL]|uniref:Lipoprotein n=1 Tax=Streptomyces polyasparticus TaxID=2767826 RepID=A0ABR7SRW4_9ACTN|nr:hypothetical protein [Streptomyces polyasparticus]MBC9717629.1 hypothetical protein [Streptomyces polyasparticus]